MSAKIRISKKSTNGSMPPKCINMQTHSPPRKCIRQYLHTCVFLWSRFIRNEVFLFVSLPQHIVFDYTPLEIISKIVNENVYCLSIFTLIIFREYKSNMPFLLFIFDNSEITDMNLILNGLLIYYQLSIYHVSHECRLFIFILSR